VVEVLLVCVGKQRSVWGDSYWGETSHSTGSAELCRTTSLPHKQRRIQTVLSGFSNFFYYYHCGYENSFREIFKGWI